MNEKSYQSAVYPLSAQNSPSTTQESGTKQCKRQNTYSEKPKKSEELANRLVKHDPIRHSFLPALDSPINIEGVCGFGFIDAMPHGPAFFVFVVSLRAE